MVPDWLAEVVRVSRTPVPWAQMIRAAVAICGPLAVATVVGQRATGLLVAMGGLMGTVVDRGGPYATRVKRVASAAIFGGAAGLAIGSLIHGHGWLVIVALVVVAAVSALLTALGAVGSVTGLQLLVYTVLGVGPLGSVRPWWHAALGFLLGTVWAVLLTVPAWLLAPRAAEQRSVAAVYRALATQLAATGSSLFAETRRDVTAAFNAAYDAVLTARSAASGQDRTIRRLMALLNLANLVAEAALALSLEGNRPPQPVIDAVERTADAINGDRAVEIGVPELADSPAAAALRDALAQVARLISIRSVPRAQPQRVHRSLRDRADAVPDRVGRWLEQVVGRFSATYTLRLMASIGVAGVVLEMLPLTRSYWVVLTVAIVLKPDFGSVFARAVQRGVGTILGAVLGAVILAVVPYGPWLLLPLGVLAALLPYGQSRNYGLFAVFLTPLVVVLVDLLEPQGWHLALSRLLDTLLGCAIVLLVGYAPWPSSWHSQLPAQFARAVRDVAQYMEEALVAPPVRPAGGAAGQQRAAALPGTTGLARKSRLRRGAYRALSDLRTEFQRTMSEPAAVRRQATAWWPALVGLEEVMDAVTATSVAIGAGAPAPAPRDVRQLAAALGAVADLVEGGGWRQSAAVLPADEALRPVTETVYSVLRVVASDKPPALAAG